MIPYDHNLLPTKSIINGYKVGANITLLNVIYIPPKKTDTGQYSDDILYIIFKDLDTNEKKMVIKKNPMFRYFVAKDPSSIKHFLLNIETSKVRAVECKYRNLKQSIAKELGVYDRFIYNIKTGNYKNNDKLLYSPNIFNSDMDIEDFYRFEFSRLYQNNPYPVSKLYLDIETDTSVIGGVFDDTGRCPINAVTLTDESNKKVYTLILEDNNNPQIQEFKNNTSNILPELKNFVINHVGIEKASMFNITNFDFNIFYFKKEINLILFIFKIINANKPDFVLCWNLAFDLYYIINRIRFLGYNPLQIISHPDFEYKSAYYIKDTRNPNLEEKMDMYCITSYSVFLDQMVTFASRRKGQRAIMGGYKLDNIGKEVAKIRKLDYSDTTHNLSQLPMINYKKFIFYNVIDTIVQLCIEKSVNDIDFVFNKTLNTITKYSKIHRQLTYLKNRFIKDAIGFGYVVGNNINKYNKAISDDDEDNDESKFEGALVADPTKFSDKYKIKINGKPIDLLMNVIDEDFTSLYPSIMKQNNISPDTMLYKIILPEKVNPDENTLLKDNDSFDRSSSFVEDLLSTDYIDFGYRHLGLPSYEEMYNYIYTYFTKVRYPLSTGSSLPTYDKITGKYILYHNIPQDHKRLLYRVINDDKNYKKLLYKLIEIVPDIKDIIQSKKLKNNKGDNS